MIKKQRGLFRFARRRNQVRATAELARRSNLRLFTCNNPVKSVALAWGAIAHLGQGCVSADPSTFEARRLAAVRLRCDSFSPLCVACPTSPRITAASCHLLRLLLGSRPHSRADQRSASSADQCSTRWRLREEPHQCPCECRPIHAQFSKDHLRLSAVQVSLAVISRMRISVALTTREGTSSGHAMPRCACDSGPILTFFR